MSHYGPPPGGPYQPYPEYPDQGGYESPSDPWGQPAESWGREPDSWGGQAFPPPGYPPSPGYPEPGYPEPGYPPRGYDGPPPGYPPRGYDGPPPGYEPPRRGYAESADDRDPPYRETLSHEPLWDDSRPRHNVGLYATVAVLVVLAATGVGYALYVLSGDGGEPVAVETAAPTPGSSPPATPEPSGTPGDNVGLNAATAQIDDCLVNDGNAEETQLRIVRCDDDEDAAVYRVLAVFSDGVEGEDDDARHESAQATCSAVDGYTHHYFEVDDDSGFVLCMAEQE